MPLKSLNPEQLSAAKAPFGNTLVIASAGTGKTSTIVARIYNLLMSGVEPEKILLLTFTNKAAGEMVQRLKKYFDKDQVAKITAGTFHSFALKWLRLNGFDVALKQPKELKRLFETVYDRYIGKLKFGETQAYSAGYLYEFYESWQSACEPNFVKFIEARAPHQKEHDGVYLTLLEEFEELKKECGFVSFNDLLVVARDELEKLGGGVYFEALVDEYQDTNNLQYSLINSIHPSSLFCVGDYDQSIYGFNGANIEIIAGFLDKRANAKLFMLSKNYRSLSPILSLADKVISKNPRVYPKKLEVMRSGHAAQPRLLSFDDTIAQYYQVGRIIADSSTKPEEIAVLFRNNSSADGIEAALREYGIKCKRKGGVSFFESREIKAALDLITIVTNPRDILAFIHIFEFAHGVGAATAKEFYDALLLLGGGSITHGIAHPDANVKNPFEGRKREDLGLFADSFELGSVSRFRDLHLDEKMLSHPLLKHPKLTTEGVLFIADFFDLCAKLSKLKTAHSVMLIIKESALYMKMVELLARQRATLKDKSIDEKIYEEAKERIFRKLSLLIDLSRHYDDKKAFLNAMILGAGEMNEGEGVNLMTVHASKGLEFEDVYIIDLMEGRFPNTKLMAKGSSLEEERRLFYVSVTRAKNTLTLSFAKYDKIKKKSYEPSIFLKEADAIK
jgi:DNA helicase II / ATP-dependent DNA helicase PcrA